MRERLNEITRVIPKPPAESENLPRQTITLGEEGPFSSIKREEELKLKKRISELEESLTSTQATLSEKLNLLNNQNIKIAQLEGELLALKQVSSGMSSDKRETFQILMQKDEIIKSLEKKIAELNSLLERTKNQLSDLQEQWAAHTARERDEVNVQSNRRIEELEGLLRDRDSIILSLQAEIEELRLEIELKGRKFKKPKSNSGLYPRMVYFDVKTAPKVERVYNAAVEVRYEQDPYIVEQNQKLAAELEISLVLFSNNRKTKNYAIHNSRKKSKKLTC